MATDDADYSVDGDQAVTDMIQHERLSIGFGCSSRACSDDVIRLIEVSVDQIPSGTMLATLDRRASIGEIVASLLGLRLVLIPASILASVAEVPHTRHWLSLKHEPPMLRKHPRWPRLALLRAS